MGSLCISLSTEARIYNDAISAAHLSSLEIAVILYQLSFLLMYLATKITIYFTFYPAPPSTCAKNFQCVASSLNIIINFILISLPICIKNEENAELYTDSYCK